MWYWTHFVMRMMARAGLSLAVIAWVVSQQGESHTIVPLWGSKGMPGPAQLDVTAGPASVVVILFPSQWGAIFYGATWGFRAAGHSPELIIVRPSEPNADPVVQLAGVKMWIEVTDYYAAKIDHWLLILTFLIATVATSWRRKAKVVPTEERVPEAVTESE